MTPTPFSPETEQEAKDENIIGPKVEIESNPENVEVGDIIVTRFSTAKGPKGEDRLVSREKGRKHLFPEQFGAKVFPGDECYVKVTRDTNPAEERKGALAGEILGRTPRSFMRDHLGEVNRVLEFSPEEEFKGKVDMSNENEVMAAILKEFPSVGGMDKRIKVVNAGMESEDGRLDKSRMTIFVTDGEEVDSDNRYFDVEDIFKGMFTDPIDRSAEKDSDLFKEQEVDLPAIELLPESNTIRFLDVEVEKIGSESSLVPSKQRFRYYTLDENTLLTTSMVASAFGRRSPLFLEGDTAVSKTSSVEFFASHIGAEVRRINLSGQTDTSELIGKFIPNDGSMQIAFERHIKGWNSVDEETKEAALRKLKPETVKIMEEAAKRGDTLTVEESTQIAKLEGFNISENQWVWQDGILPQAMKRGQILILDELTLAEAQVVERINSALEDPPSIVLTENGGVKIGEGGDFEVHKNFWVVGTGNPGGMAGRSALSEALSRRFTDYYRVPNPTREHFKQMLELMIYGKQPQVTIDGVTYTTSEIVETEFAELADDPNVEEFITHLSQFHEDVTDLANPKTKTIGKERHRTGGKYTFTRATLTSVLGYITKERILDVVETKRTGKTVYKNDFLTKAKRALKRFYIDPVVKDDKQEVIDAMNKYDNRWFQGVAATI